MATNTATSGFPIDWSALKAFIADKEAYEEKNGHPAPLTDSQRDAINTLIPPKRPPINPVSDDKINWIGMLNGRNPTSQRHPASTSPILTKTC